MTWKYIAAVFCAGGLGALSRFELTSLVNKLAGDNFPLGTMVVNMVGCFLFGALWELISHHLLGDPIRVIILVGFVGSFTTFSSFIFDCIALGQVRLGLAAVNFIFQSTVGFACVFIGIYLMKLCLK